MFKTASPVVIYPSSGTGAWEAALLNTLSPGDKVLMYETGHFATLWKNIAVKLGLDPEFIASDWRSGADAAAIEARLAEDKGHAIKAVCVVHNETSTGATSRIDEVRRAMDAARHPALLMVDTISSLASIDYRHDEWGVDVTVGGSQKGLMLPPGLGFNAISDKALAAAKAARLPKSYFGWEEMLAANKDGFFPYTPATNLLYGLAEAIDMLHEEGLTQSSPVTTAMPRPCAARSGPGAWRSCAGTRSTTPPPSPPFSCPQATTPTPSAASRWTGSTCRSAPASAKVAGKVFRIGHLGDTNDLTIVATLAGVEMALALAGVPHKPAGVAAAMAYFTETAKAGRA